MPYPACLAWAIGAPCLASAPHPTHKRLLADTGATPAHDTALSVPTPIPLGPSTIAERVSGRSLCCLRPSEMDAARLLLLWPLLLLAARCPSATDGAPQVGTGTGSPAAPVASATAGGLVSVSCRRRPPGRYRYWLACCSCGLCCCWWSGVRQLPTASPR